MKKVRTINLIVLAALVLSACSAQVPQMTKGAVEILESAANTIEAKLPVQSADPVQPVKQATAEPLQIPDGAAEVLAAYQGVLQSIYQQVNPSVVNIRVLTSFPATGGLDEGGLPFGIPGMPQNPFGQNPFGQDGEEDQPQFAESAGSGFVWDTAGQIVTNNHVVEGASKVEVTFSDGTTVEAEIVGTDKDSDLAVLRVDAPKDLLLPLQLADSADVQVGQLAIAIGNPFGLEGTMTVGIISAVGRSISINASSGMRGGYSLPDVIQTDAPINPGNSGGVLVNDQGQVVGVTYMIESTSGVNAGIGFAIPSSIVDRVVPALIENGKFQHPYLGISGSDLTAATAGAMDLSSDQRSILVHEVVAGGPAEKAGLQGSTKTVEIDGEQLEVGGDVITAIDGEPVETMSDLISYLANQTSVGQEVRLTVLRGGDTREIEVELEARPADNEKIAGNFQPGDNQQTPSSAWLGVNALDLTPQLAEALSLDQNQTGVLVVDVAENSPAEQAGLRGSDETTIIDGQRYPAGGDVIIGYDGEPVTSMEDLTVLLSQAKPEQVITLTIIRGNEQMDLEVTLGIRTN